MKKRRIVSLVLCLAVVLGALVFPSVAADTQQDIANIKFVDLSIGLSHTMALDTNGNVWTWGFNALGQCGIGSFEETSGYSQVDGLADVQQISAGGYFSLALLDDGSVWAWGDNGNGNIGDGTYINRSSPAHVASLESVNMLHTSRNSSYAICDDGTVYVWGFGGHGQLGLGNTQTKSVPTLNDSLKNVSLIKSGVMTAFIVLNDGSVWGWGYNNHYNVTSTETNSIISSPTQINIQDVDDITAGGYHTMALKDGKVYTWGTHRSGQLGIGDLPNDRTIHLVPTLYDIVEIAAGSNVCFALDSDNQLWGWGAGKYLAMGDSYTTQTTPMKINIDNVLHILQASTDRDHYIVVLKDGSIWGWGNNYYGQLRPNDDTDFFYEPTLLFGSGTYVGPGVDPVDPPDPIDTVDLTNLVQSPDYTDLSDWYVAPEIATMEADDGILTLTIDSDDDMNIVNLRQDVPMDTSHIYYVRASMYFDKDTFPGADYYYTVLNLGNNQLLNVRYTSGWSTVSAIGSPSHNGNHRFQQMFRVSPTGIHEGGVMQSREPMVIDLTEAFGAGNEPSVAWCDANIPFFSGSTTISV